MNYFFVRENGLFVLREGSEIFATLYFDYYSGEFGNVLRNLLAIMILGVVLIFCVMITMLPIVFLIDRYNKEILSFFGMIPLEDIKLLIIKADEYQKSFIEKFSDIKDE